MRIVSKIAKGEGGLYVLFFDPHGGLRTIGADLYSDDLSDGELLERSHCLASPYGYVPLVFIYAIEGTLHARYAKEMRRREWEQKPVMYPFTSYQQLSCFVSLYENELIRSVLPDEEKEPLMRLIQAYVEWLLEKDREMVNDNPAAWLQPAFYPAEVKDNEGDFDIYNRFDALPLKGFAQAAFYFAIANSAYTRLCSVTQIDNFAENAKKAVSEARELFDDIEKIELQPGTVRPLAAAYLQEQFYQYSQRSAEDVSVSEDDIWRTIYAQEQDALALLNGYRPRQEIFKLLLNLQEDVLERMLKEHVCLNEWINAKSNRYPAKNDYEGVIQWLAYQKTRGNDYYKEAKNNRTKMCKDLTDLFGWDVDQNSLQQHERRKLLKERKQKNAIK